MAGRDHNDSEAGRPGEMQLDLNDPDITCAAGAKGIVGPDRVLIDQDDNLLASYDVLTMVAERGAA